MNPALGQGPAGQPNGMAAASQPGAQQGRQSLPLYRPEMMQSLSILTDEEKLRYEKGLRQLYSQVEVYPANSPQQNEVKKKILEFSKMLHQKVMQRRLHDAQARQAQGQAPGQGQGPAQGQASQGPAAGAAGQQADAAKTQSAPGGPGGTSAAAQSSTTAATSATSGPAAGTNVNAPAARAPGGQPGLVPVKVPDQIAAHINNMTYNPPAALGLQGVQATKWSNDMKTRYTKALMTMEQSRRGIQTIEKEIKERADSGNPLGEADLKATQSRKEELSKRYGEADNWVKAFRRSQETSNKAVQQTGQQRPGGAPKPASGAAAGPATTRPAQAAQTVAISTSLPQAATATVSAAIEAARNQQVPVANRAQGANPKPQPAAPQAATTQSSAPSQPTIPAQAAKAEQPHLTPVNTAIASTAAAAQAPSAGIPAQNRVQTPQTATPTTAGPVRPLTHQAALERANQRVSQPDSAQSGQAGTGTPVGGAAAGSQLGQQHQHHQTPPLPSTLNPRMPIQRELPEKATQVPQAVSVSVASGVAPGRPTYTGGSGVSGGVIGQPAVPKIPAYSHEAEGDHVLSKKKLDELVRQVCGGTAEDQDGNLLSPEVEESILNMADSFIDNVLNSACRNAKERGSKVLEIRDLQLVLERTYNIRVPGYSSDELRTVRKIQPSANWITKMSAVQAAKVMPSKGE